MRCLFLLPDSPRLGDVQDLRLESDLLARKMPPHITVEFPFIVERTRHGWEALLLAVGTGLPNRFTLGPPILMDESIVFPVDHGVREIVALQDRLLAGLPVIQRARAPFLPHLTFGRVHQDGSSRSLLARGKMLLPFEGLARVLVLERIGENGESIVEAQVTAGRPPMADLVDSGS